MRELRRKTCLSSGNRHKVALQARAAFFTRRIPYLKLSTSRESRIGPSAGMKGKKAVKHLLFVRRTIYGALLVSLSLLICTAAWAKPLEPLRCGAGGVETLTPTGDRTNSPKQDLLVLGICYVDGTTGNASPLLYVFHNVNMVRSGQLIFCDRFDIDFWAESILVENLGELRAVSTQCGAVATPGSDTKVKDLLTVMPFQKRLTFHSWGRRRTPVLRARANRPAATARHAVFPTILGLSTHYGHEHEHAEAAGARQ